MSQIDINALESNFAKWRQDRAPDEKESKAFEIYSIGQVLKDADLSDDEVAAGNFGGGDDGGVDGMYLFINRNLILDETELPDPAITVELVIIQAKYQKSFTEDTIQKLDSFCRDLLDFSKGEDKLTLYNSSARDAIIRFREKYNQVMGSPHSLKISFHYTTKSIDQPNHKIDTRVENLKVYIKSQLSAAEVIFEFWDCAKMLASARAIPKQEAVIEITNNFSTDDGSVVCLLSLNNFAAFLTSERGELKTSILEPNVRDYQSKANPVNKDIRATLNNSSSKEEFWWLNNGITLLAEKCAIIGNKVTITKPEIVNGLQTSHEVFEFFHANPGRKDPRKILLRIIVAPEERSRNNIIQATNSQTPVSRFQLKATDRIHFDIEDRLKLYGLFYDRRKGENKRCQRPISKIVSIPLLAQAVIAVLLQRPSDARGRPQTLLNKPETYDQIFNETYNRDVYAVCIMLDRQVRDYLERGQLQRDARRDIRYYMTMLVACELTKSSTPDINAIAGILKDCNKLIDDSILSKCQENSMKVYSELGANDKAAKSPQMQEKIIALAKSLFTPTA
jgi:AIPR protein